MSKEEILCEIAIAAADAKATGVLIRKGTAWQEGMYFCKICNKLVGDYHTHYVPRKNGGCKR